MRFPIFFLSSASDAIDRVVPFSPSVSCFRVMVVVMVGGMRGDRKK